MLLYVYLKICKHTLAVITTSINQNLFLESSFSEMYSAKARKNGKQVPPEGSEHFYVYHY